MIDKIARAMAGAGAGVQSQITDIFQKTHEPTGFALPQDTINNLTDYVNLSFDKTSLIFSISPTGVSYQFYSDGILFTKTAVETITISDLDGFHYFYFDNTGTLRTSQSNPFFYDGNVAISYLYWNVSEQKEVIFGNEMHGSVMDWATHLCQHESIGTRYINGLLLGDYILNGNGSINSHAQLSVTNGQIDDEDIRFFIKHSATPTKFGEQFLTSIAQIPVMYRSGTNWNIDTATNWPVKQGTARIAYNLNTAGDWSTPDVTRDGQFVSMWIFASSIKEPVFAIMGQRQDDTLEAAITNNTFSSLDLTNMPFFEFKILWRLIFKTDSTYLNVPKATLEDITSQLNIQGIQISSIATADHSSLTNRNAISSHPLSAISFSDTDSELGVSDSQSAVDLVAQGTLYKTSGVIGQPTITDNRDGSITVGNIYAMTYDNINFVGRLLKSNIAGGIYTLTDQSINYLAVNHNSGTPVYLVTTNRALLNGSDVLFVNTMFRDGTEIHFLSWDSPAEGLPEKIQERLISTQRFARESGLILSESAGRIINITEGVTWNGTAKIFLDAFTSATEPRAYFYHVGGVWTRDNVGTQYKNDVYDDGTDLVIATAGKYLVNWIYRAEESLPHAYLLLGSDEYDTVAQASESQPPNALPPMVSDLSILIGQIIVKVGEETATLIDSAFGKEFTPAAINTHNDLSFIQGGGGAEYYHLTQSENNKVVNFASTVRGTILTGISFLVDTAILATDTVLEALGKLQKQVDGKEPALATPVAPTTKYYRGDKSWQTLNSVSVGLGSVVNADTTTTANIADSTNKRFSTDAQLLAITHANRTNLDSINQDLGTTSTPTFLNDKVTGYRIDGVSSTPVGSGNIDNWAIASVAVLIVSSSTGNFTIRGIAGGVTGRMLTVINSTTNNMTISSLNAGSTAGNQIDTLGGNFTTTGKGAVQMVYDGTNWKVISTVS